MQGTRSPQELVRIMKKALEEEAKVPPGKRLNGLIKSGVIDGNGRLIRKNSKADNPPNQPAT